MLKLEAVMQFYSEQALLQDSVLILDQNANILFMNGAYSEALYSTFGISGIDCDAGNNCLLYEHIAQDISDVQKNGVLQCIRQIKQCNNLFHWVSMQMVFCDIGSIFIIYLKSIPSTCDALYLLKLKNETKSTMVQHFNKNYMDNRLNSQEQEIVRLLVLGYTQKLITLRLKISRTTLNKIFAKISNKVFNAIVSSKLLKEYFFHKKGDHVNC